ncbi:unnamed protein product, partial [Heterosigma akashiwo]
YGSTNQFLSSRSWAAVPLAKKMFSFSSSSCTEVTEHCHRFLTSHDPKCDLQMEGICNNDDEIFALIVLNTDCCTQSFRRLWGLSTFRLCADGGANRLHDSLRAAGGERARHVPHAIKGDLDSLRPEVGEFYRSLGAEIIHDGDQDCNDFQKCLREARARRDAHFPGRRLTALALGAFGGRFDQEMAAVHACFEFQRGGSRDRVVLLSDENLGLLLGPGRHRLAPNPALEGPTCGLLPIGGPVSSLTTTGLKWNLSNEPVRFGGLISTSNKILGPVVEVTTSDPLLWMTQLHPAGWGAPPPEDEGGGGEKG